jgi:urease gamma subunit
MDINKPKKIAKKVQVRLTPLQWANIAARVRFGESKASLAREYGITRQAIHWKLPGLQEESPIETAASKIVIAHEYVQSGVKGMHPKLQVEAWDMAKNLIAISENLTEGALYGAMNFFKLAKLAQEMTESMLADGIDINTLGAISAITKTANEAAAPSMNLLNINKQTVDRLTKTGDIIGKKTLADFYGIPTLVDDTPNKDNK